MILPRLSKPICRDEESFMEIAFLIKTTLSDEQVQMGLELDIFPKMMQDNYYTYQNRTMEKLRKVIVKAFYCCIHIHFQHFPILEKRPKG